MHKVVRFLLCLLILLRGWVGGGMVVHAMPGPAPQQSVGTVAADPAPVPHAAGADAASPGAQAHATGHPPGCPGAVADGGGAESPAGACQLCSVCHGPALAAALAPAAVTGCPAAAPADGAARLSSALLPVPTEPPIS